MWRSDLRHTFVIKNTHLKRFGDKSDWGIFQLACLTRSTQHERQQRLYVDATHLTPTHAGKTHSTPTPPQTLAERVCSNKDVLRRRFAVEARVLLMIQSISLVITKHRVKLGLTCLLCSRSIRQEAEHSWLPELNMENHFRALCLKIILVGLTWTTLVTSPLALLHTGLQKYVEGF